MKAAPSNDRLSVVIDLNHLILTFLFILIDFLHFQNSLPANTNSQFGDTFC